MEDKALLNDWREAHDILCRVVVMTPRNDLQAAIHIASTVHRFASLTQELGRLAVRVDVDAAPLFRLAATLNGIAGDPAEMLARVVAQESLLEEVHSLAAVVREKVAVAQQQAERPRGQRPKPSRRRDLTLFLWANRDELPVRQAAGEWSRQNPGDPIAYEACKKAIQRVRDEGCTIATAEAELAN